MEHPTFAAVHTGQVLPVAANSFRDGYPAITVPMGYAFGLPLGVTFMGKAWSEATLLKFAYAFEQSTKKYRLYK